MTEDNKTSEAEIISWIEKSIDIENLEKYEIIITGATDKSEGRSSNLTFATVYVTTKAGVKKEIEWAVKHGKKNEHLRKTTIVRQANEREIYFYEKILPLFTRFQLENNVKSVFNSVPKCYKTLLFDNMEVIVMENLKKNGYDLHDPQKPLNLNHLKLVLQEYGKFHALSFGLRNKNKGQFDKLTQNFDDLVKISFDMDSFRKGLQKYVVKASAILKQANEFELRRNLQKIVEKGADKVLFEILEAVEPQSAILHADSWNNNLMFKYEGEDRNTPSKVALLDWQTAKLHSPAIDLSYLLYTVCSKVELDHFDELMEIYYNSFSSFLYELGSDPELLFPFSALRTHWKKYALYGVFITVRFLQVMICDAEEVPIVDNMKEGDDAFDIFDIETKHDDLYKERIIAVISHYYRNTF